ncbi:RDD family protein [Halomonadaceae bacterium KBTZ08]
MEATTRKLDSRSHIATPEGVAIALAPAGPGVRAVAYLIDLLIRSIIYVALGFILTFAGLFGNGLLLLAYFVLEWLYPVVFELWRNGTTPGKRQMKLRVLHDDGTAVTLGGSMLRNLLRTVDILPIGYVVGLVSMMVNGQFKRLGDLVAGTLVIHEPAAEALVLAETAGVRPPPIALNRDEQRAIIDFSARAPRLSADRQRELANSLSPVLEARDDEAVTRLHQIASGLSGRSS